MSYSGSRNANVRLFQGGINALEYWIGNRLLSASDILNDSTVTGANVKLALNSLTSTIGSLTSSNILNVSGVTGATVTAALNTLSTASTAVFPFTATGLAEQDLVSYDAGAATWRNRTVAAALKGIGTNSLALGSGSFAAGTNSITIGNSAGAAVNTGGNNIGIGSDALDGVTTGVADLIAIGVDALGGAIVAGLNGTVAIGSGSLYQLASGIHNTAVGYSTGGLLTTGSSNTLFGFNVQVNAGSSDNTLVGDSIGSPSSTGTAARNTVVGSQAFNSMSTAVSDCAVLGYNALTGAISSTAPSGSVAIGSTALQACTTGLNTAVGFANQLAITTGSGNVSLGHNAMSNAGVAAALSSCTAIGAGAIGGAALTTAANGTVAVGNSALFSLTSGVGNTALGGSGAGNQITTGTYNTFLGYDTNADANSRSGCVVIGPGARATANDTLVIRMGNTSTKEIVVTPVVTTNVTAAIGTGTYIPITVGGVSYKIELKT